MKTRIIKFERFELDVEYEMNGIECILNDVYVSDPSADGLRWIKYLNGLDAEYEVLPKIADQILVEEAEELNANEFDAMEMWEMNRDV